MLLKKRYLILIFLFMIFKTAYSATPVFTIEIKNHLFYPEELVIPAHTKIKLVIYNRDKTSEEFESYELNREKIIMGNRKGIIFIGPLEPGEYPYFGEFFPETALGKLIAE